MCPFMLSVTSGPYHDGTSLERSGRDCLHVPVGKAKLLTMRAESEPRPSSAALNDQPENVRFAQQAAHAASSNTPSRRRNTPGQSLSRRQRGRLGKACTSFSKLPKELQSNQYIVSGYRLQLSAWESVKSIVGLHNETGNIWSHLLGQSCLAVILSLKLTCCSVSAQLTPFIMTLQAFYCSWC